MLLPERVAILYRKWEASCSRRLLQVPTLRFSREGTPACLVLSPDGDESADSGVFF